MDSKSSRSHGARIAWVDAMKGVAIICVVIGHSIGVRVGLLHKFLYCWHIPIFFFLSGYVYVANGWRGLAKKCDRILVPYALYSAALAVLATHPRFDGAGYWIDILLGNGIFVTWFLGCSFAVEVFGALVSRLKHPHHIWEIHFLLMSVVLGIVYQKYVTLNILSSRVLFPALSFWLLGRICSQARIFELFFSLRCKYKIIASLMCLAVAFCSPLLDIDYFVGKSGNPMIAMPVAFSVFVLISLCVRVNKKLEEVLGEIGKSSLLIMNWHVIIPLAMSLFLPPSPLRIFLNFALLIMVCCLVRRVACLGVLDGRARIFQCIARQ